jgi:hypothetical protein
MNLKTVCLICGILLLLAIPSWWPYGFYTLLRWIICGASIYIAYNFYQSKLKGWSIVFAIFAIIFNPLIPVYLTKSSWVGIDFISSILFFLSAYSTKK